MLKCPRCGWYDFDGIDTSRPFSCPIPGCGAYIQPDGGKRIPVAAVPPGVRIWQESAGQKPNFTPPSAHRHKNA